MKNLLLSLIILTITACGGPLPAKEKKVVKIAADTAPYVNSFKAISGIHIDNLEIGFASKLKSNVLAYCAQGVKTVLKFPQNETYKIQQVVISREMWDRMGASDREVLVFHELGHCILNRPHTDGILASNKPSSVMNTYHIGGNTYTGNYGYYQTELFNKPSLASAKFNRSAYTIASTLPENYSFMASSQLEVSEEMEDMPLYETVAEEDHNHDDCIRNVGHIVVDERSESHPEQE